MDITVILLMVTALIWVVYDVWTISKRGKKTSISAYIIRGSYKYPLVVLGFGVLLGHLFWSMKTADIWDVKCENIESTKEMSK
jgi:hypothetical protein